MHFDKKNDSNVFVIINPWEHITQQSSFHTTYVACCKNFVNFQFELFIETDSFKLRSIDCNWTREYQIQDDDDRVDYVYRDMYLSDSDDMFDSSDDDNVELVMPLAVLFVSPKWDPFIGFAFAYYLDWCLFIFLIDYI